MCIVRLYTKRTQTKRRRTNIAGKALTEISLAAYLYGI